MNLNSPHDMYLTRRNLLRVSALGLSGLATMSTALGADPKPPEKPDPSKASKFQIACMTLPYSRYPLERALKGLKSVGYSYVAWGTTHQEADGKKVAVMPQDATPETAKALSTRCKDLGLTPIMMFGPSPDSVEPLKQRIKQASAAGIGQILTMGSTRGNDKKLWIKNLKELGPIARDAGTMIVVKQHGGNTGTGVALLEVVQEVADAGVRMNYDAGNVMDYHKIDPLPDIKKCYDWIHSFCIKDHRMFPKDQDCGPGYGEIDHYRLLHPLAYVQRTIPLCCENISAPLLNTPETPEGLDALARRAREFLETVTQGLQS